MTRIDDGTYPRGYLAGEGVDQGIQDRQLLSLGLLDGREPPELLAEDECPIIESQDGEVGFPLGWRHRRGGSSCRGTGLGGSGDRVSRDGTFPRGTLAGEGVDQGLNSRQLLGLGLQDGRESPERPADDCDCFGCSREQKGVFHQNPAQDLEWFTRGGCAFHAGWVIQWPDLSVREG